MNYINWNDCWCDIKNGLLSCEDIVPFIDVGVYVYDLFIEDSDAFADEDEGEDDDGDEAHTFACCGCEGLFGSGVDWVVVQGWC